MVLQLQLHVGLLHLLLLWMRKVCRQSGRQVWVMIAAAAGVAVGAGAVMTLLA